MSKIKRRRDSSPESTRNDAANLGPRERAASQSLIASQNNTRAQRASGRAESTDKNETQRERASSYRADLNEEKALREYLDKLRDLLCRTAIFDSKFSRKNTEPKETEGDRGAVERTMDWTGLDSFALSRKETSLMDFFTGIDGAASDFRAQQSAMLAESRSESGELRNVPERDKFYHCMANCEGNSRGPGGELASAAISSVKELKDVGKTMLCKDWSYGAASRDSMRDQAANRVGRDAGRSGLRCTDVCGKNYGGGIRTGQ